MLLNELQQQEQKIATQDRRAAIQDVEIGHLKAQLAEIHAALLTLRGQDQLARR